MAAVHGVAKGWTPLKQQGTHAQRDQKDITRLSPTETESVCAPQIQTNMYAVFFGKDIKECEVNQINT